MTLILCNLAALSVVVLHLAWRAHRDVLARRHQCQRERVALLLWTVAMRDEDQSSCRETSLEV